MKGFLGSCLLVLGLCYGGYCLFFTGYLRLNYPSISEYPIQGLDISHHQGEILWDVLKKQGYRFIYIKSTEGGDFRDSRFSHNWKNALASGFVVGAYHYFTLCTGGHDQGKIFIDIVPNEMKMLPPVIDLEFGGNCGRRPTREQLFIEIHKFSKLLMDHYKRKPILYVTSDFFHFYSLKGDFEFNFWVRDIYGKPTIPNSNDWLFWQFANRGHVEGIQTYVDLNVFNGDEDMFQRLIQKGL